MRHIKRTLVCADHYRARPGYMLSEEYSKKDFNIVPSIGSWIGGLASLIAYGILLYYSYISLNEMLDGDNDYYNYYQQYRDLSSEKYGEFNLTKLNLIQLYTIEVRNLTEIRKLESETGK